MPTAAGSEYDAPPEFLPARPITQADLAALTERVRDPWYTPPHRPHPLHARASQGGHLGRPGPLAKVPPAGGERRRRTLTFRVSRPARRSRAAAAEAPASVPRSLRTESQAQARRHGARARQRRQAAEAGGHAIDGHGTGGCCDANQAHQKPRSHDTSRIAWAKLMARVGGVVSTGVPTCGGDIRLRGDGRQEPAHFEPEVRKREQARMAAFA